MRLEPEACRISPLFFFFLLPSDHSPLFLSIFSSSLVPSLLSHSAFSRKLTFRRKRTGVKGEDISAESLHYAHLSALGDAMAYVTDSVDDLQVFK